jgi:hypothetical protein
MKNVFKLEPQYRSAGSGSGLRRMLSVFAVLLFVCACVQPLSLFAQTQLIRTYVGTGLMGYTGDGGQANLAKNALPVGVIFDASGNFFFVVDEANNVIRKVDVSTGIITGL